MSKSTAEDEYSLQYFGFTPEEFVKDFLDVILEEVTLLIQYIIQEIPELPDLAETIKKECIEIHDILCDCCKDVMVRLKPLIQEMFTIPKNVCLPIDVNKQKEYTEEEVKSLELEVEELEQRYAETLTTIEYRKTHIRLFELLEPVYQKMDEAMPLLKEIGENVNQLKELNKIAAVHNEKKQKLAITKKDEMESFAYMFRTS